MKINKAIKVSQLTAYEKRRLNKNRKCTICGEEILDYQIIDMIKIRDRRKVFYNFNHHKCAISFNYEDMIYGKEK